MLFYNTPTIGIFCYWLQVLLLVYSVSVKKKKKCTLITLIELEGICPVFLAPIIYILKNKIHEICPKHDKYAGNGQHNNMYFYSKMDKNMHLHFSLNPISILMIWQLMHIWTSRYENENDIYDNLNVSKLVKGCLLSIFDCDWHDV